MIEIFNIKKELKKLEIKYLKEKKKLIKKCKHNWEENGYTSDKYCGIQYYKCSICDTERGEGF